ncbi:hypothetical protein TNCV_3498481 [Trichonephila clavipes]|nr:hypothetical protein TNCV_3498481 [Trichonephila clavipes]
MVHSQVWASMGQIRDVDQAQIPLITVGKMLPSYREVEGREKVEDDERSGRPQTSRTSENIEKISAGVSTKCIRLQNTITWRATDPVIWEKPLLEKGKDAVTQKSYHSRSIAKIFHVLDLVRELLNPTTYNKITSFLLDLGYSTFLSRLHVADISCGPQHED